MCFDIFAQTENKSLLSELAKSKTVLEEELPTLRTQCMYAECVSKSIRM